MNTNQILCPNCGSSISVEEILQHQIEDKIKKEFAAKQSANLNELKKREEEMKERELQFELKKKQENEIFMKRLEEEKNKIKEEETIKAKNQSQVELEAVKKMLASQQEENQKLQKLQIDLLNKDQELINLKAQNELEIQKKLIEQRDQLFLEVRKKADEENQVKNAMLAKQIEDQHKLIEEMKRKAEQGSMQMQGEVQELALESILKNAFPYDHIEEVKKGVLGADCIQTVNNEFNMACGQIIFESKNTKEFSKSWIEKLKSDMRSQGADIAVLVTKTMPVDMDRFGVRDGIWICGFQEVKSLVTALRFNLISVSHALQSQENKGDKMQMLYAFLTSNEFKQQIEAIVEGFTAMQQGINKEKLQMEKIWKEREKQIDKVLMNTTHFYGAVKGIAGNAIGNIPALELGE